jgi:TatD DNase family protein
MNHIDIHAHLDFPDFDIDREELIADMLSKDIGAFNVGTSLETSKNSIVLAEKHKNIWAIVGVHPIHAGESLVNDLEKIELLIIHPKCVAIGECGLDFFKKSDDMENKKIQLEFFEKQIELALTYNKSLMIHCRQAYPETLDVLENYKKSHPELRAHFHFFTESIDTARRVLDNGFTVSFTGPITFADYEELVKFVPLESLMIETDSPYASPKSVRGKRNDPRNVIEIGVKIAQIKGLPEDEVFGQIKENIKRVFGV